ncbi:hypothetical protein PSHT_03766, partial [Puccinia striiformis]
LASELPSLFPLVNEPSKFSKISLGLYKVIDLNESGMTPTNLVMWKVSGQACSSVGTHYKISLLCFPAILMCDPSVEFAKSGLQNPKISSALQMALLSVVPIKKEAVSSVLISNVVGVLTASMTDTPSVSTSDPNQISDKVVEQTDQQSLQAIKPLSSWPPNILSITLVVCLLLLVIAARDSDIQILGNVIKSGSEDGHEELNYGN